MTINELKHFCELEIQKGNGDKKVLISRDDEGNGYHNLFYSFTDVDDIDDILDLVDDFNINEKNIKDYIVLG